MHSHVIPKERQPNLQFAPANICIYCRRGPEEVELGREHIIPDGIGGHLILPQASCSDCAKIINKYEAEAIRNNFGQPRDGWGIQSKKKRRVRAKRRSHYLNYAETDESGNAVSYPVSPEMPMMINLEHTGTRPTIFTGENVSTSTVQVHCSGLNFDKVRGPFQTQGFKFYTGRFTRFVAKTAHAYASAVLGPDRFDPWLLSYILSFDADTYPYLIGLSPNEGRREGLHQIHLGVVEQEVGRLPGMPVSKRKLVVVHLEFFSPFEAPVLEAVVGEMT